MLKDDFYIVQKLTGTGNAITAAIQLNEKHPIFKGHFPSQPVLPGACMLQIIKEIAEDFLNSGLQLTKAADIRFSAIVDPLQSNQLRVLIEYSIVENDAVNINAKIIKADDAVCCKMRSSYKKTV